MAWHGFVTKIFSTICTSDCLAGQYCNTVANNSLYRCNLILTPSIQLDARYSCLHAAVVHMCLVSHTHACSRPIPSSHLCTGSSGGMPEGKDPEMDSETARKKDPFFKEVDKRTK